MAGLVVRAAPSWNRQLGIGSHVALVVTVNEGTGAPVAGLQASDFHVFDAGGHGGIEDSPAISPFESFREHSAGGAQARTRSDLAAVGSGTRSSSLTRQAVRTAVGQ